MTRGSPEPLGAMQSRTLFLLLAIGALAALLSRPPGGFLEEGPMPRRLLLLAILVTCLGMAMPWGRWISLSLPGRDLGFVSKLFGWAGGSVVPFAVHMHSVIAVSICVLLPLVALALWRQKSWAAWPWYVI